MATKTQYLTYFIVLPDEALVKSYQAQYPVGVNRAPYDAATAGGAAIEFGAPWKGASAPPGPAPYSWSAFAALGVYSDIAFPINVATFTRKTGGFLGIGGTTTRFYWIGQFVYLGDNGAAPAAVDAPALVYAPIAKRRYIDGFDAPLNGALPTAGTMGLPNSRDAAQQTGGYGLAYRGANGNNGTTPILSTWTPGLLDNGSWIRGYIRLRQLPDVTAMFYRAHGAPSGQSGVALSITPSGQIAVTNISNVATKVLLGTFPNTLPVWSGLPDDDAWRRIDLLIYYNNEPGPTPPGAGIIRCYVNGVFQTTFSVDVATGGLGQNSMRHTVDVIGDDFSVANTLELDLDNWVNAAIPPGRNGPTFNLWGEYEIDGVTPHAYVVGNIVLMDAEDHVYICKTNHSTHDGAGISATRPSLRTGGTYWNRYEGKDWLNGSKIVLARPKAFGAAHGASWTGANGDFRQLEQNGWGGGSPGSTLSSSTSGAIAEVDTDTDLVVDLEKQGVAQGAIAAMVSSLDAQGTAAGLVGFTVGGVTTTRSELGAAGFFIAQQAVMSPNGITIDPVDVSPFLARYVKGADGTAASLKSLVAQFELCGVFSKADWLPDPVPSVWITTVSYGLGEHVSYLGLLYKSLIAGNSGQTPSTSPAAWSSGVVPPAFPISRGAHNAPYPRSPWGQDALAAPPSAAFIVHTGTYVGNNTGQDLLFRLPVHALFIRPTTGGTGGFMPWISAGISGHFGGQQRLYPNIVEASEDPTFVPVVGQDNQQQRYRVRLSGQDTQLNATGVTYQYFAVSDPGARFLLTGAFAHHQNQVNVDNKLADAGFTPDFVMLQGESYDNTATIRFYGKGPQNAVNTIAGWSATVVNTALSIAAGILRSQTTLHSQAIAAWAYAAWRKADGNNDPNQNAVMSTGGYVGDGAASRTFTLPTTGKRPLAMFIFAESGNSFFRDPGHTGTTSSDNTGTINAASGITAGGIDSVTIGAAANSGGVNYNYILFWGSATAGNGGWSINGEFIPVEAAAGPGNGGMWGGDPLEADVIASQAGAGGGGGTVVAPAEEPDLDNAIALPGTALFCNSFTQKIANIALSRIGQSKQITNIVTGTTIEAVTSRLHIKADIDQVLRDFDWPFATRYADLVLVAGTEAAPVNKDWTYSYRAPTGMVKARRIVGQSGQKRNYDANPILFRKGTDALGELIYTNAVATAATSTQPAIPVQLEYTIRMSCPAYQGDPLFRDALAWKHAASLAMPLARDSQKQKDCLKMYYATLPDATSVAANESEQAKDGDAPWISERN